MLYARFMGTQVRIGMLYRQSIFLAALVCLWPLLDVVPAVANTASSSSISVDALSRQADTLNADGRYSAAEPLYRQALEAVRSANGEKDLETAQAYDNLGSNLSQQGRYAEADTLLRNSLDIVRETLGDTNAGTAATYNNLAANLFAWGRYKDAEPFYRRALEINRSALGEDHPNTATSYTNLAANLVKQGRNDEANKLNRTDLVNVRPSQAGNSQATAARYNSMGYALFNRERYEEADPFFRKALEINRAMLGEKHPDTAMSYNNLASALSGMTRFAEAEPFYRQALEIDRAVLGENHPFTARGYSNLATNLNQQSRYAEAEGLSLKAVETARRAMQAGLGTTGQDQDQPGSSARPFEDLFNDYLGIAWNLSKENPAEQNRLAATAFRVTQDAMRSTSAAAMAQAAVRTAGGSDELAKAVREEQDLTTLVADLNKKLLASLAQESASDEARLKTAYDGAFDRLTVIGARINRDFPAYRELVSSQPLDLTETQRALAPDEGLLILMTSGEEIYSFAVTPQSIAWNWIGQDDARRVLEQVITLRCEVDWKTCPPKIQDKLDLVPFTPFEEKLFRRYDLDIAYALYRQLIAPVAAALHGAKRLYVTSSGTLGDLPLGMLVSVPPVQADFANPAVLLSAQWLGDRYAMTTLPAVSALRLKALRKATQSISTPFRGYGDPLLDGTNLPDGGYGFFRGASNGLALADPDHLQTLSPLPGTRTELSAMADLFGDDRTALQLGNSATETALRQDRLIRTADVIALATHGLLPSRQFKLDEPGLVFTPPASPSPTDDGILTASEASALSLSADWVILSACNTASTANGAGGIDNLSALSRGFLYAGAHALLASHWRVSDEATAALTVETLSARRASSKPTRGEALQQAMRSIRTGKRPDGTPIKGWSRDWAHPSAWAAFTHIANQDQ